MEHRFLCTACGKCCSGWLPLTLDEAIAHAGVFPLAMVWTPVRRGARNFDLSCRLGLPFSLRQMRPEMARPDLAILIMPTAYLPQSMPCPLLDADGLCRVHATKPLRCRTMPFYPYQEETEQRSHLTPRAGWVCDISANAPVVYRDRTILAADDFNREKAALLAQAPTLAAYAGMLLKTTPPLAGQLARIAKNPGGGKLVVDFASFLSVARNLDTRQVAEHQIPVLQHYATRTTDVAALAEYHRNYQDFAERLRRYL